MGLSGNQRLFQNGPASATDKLMRRRLIQMGVKEERMPAALKDTVVKKTKRGPIGSIVVRNMSGLETNAALRVVRRFEQNVGGKEEIAEKLSAVQDTLTAEQKNLLVLLRSSSRKSLAHLMADTGVEPTQVMGAYAKGCVALGRIQAAIEAHRNLPGLIKDLYRHALDKETICKVCVGLKEVPANSRNPNGPKEVCPQCDGTGISLVASKHKEFAHRQLLEVTKLVNGEKGPTVQVNQQVAVGTGQRPGFFETMLETADAIVFPEKERVIDAEILEKGEEEPSTTSE